MNIACVDVDVCVVHFLFSPRKHRVPAKCASLSTAMSSRFTKMLHLVLWGKVVLVGFRGNLSGCLYRGRVLNNHYCVVIFSACVAYCWWRNRAGVFPARESEAREAVS